MRHVPYLQPARSGPHHGALVIVHHVFYPTADDQIVHCLTTSAPRSRITVVL